MNATQLEKAQRLRELHQQPGLFVIPNPWDAGSARVLSGLGFHALATSSAACAIALGCRDGAISRDEAIDHVRAIVNATELPVSADLENGFGDAPSFAAETLRLAADAGAVGGSIEDATGDDRRPLYEFSLAVERVAAAVEAARAMAFPFTFTARAENFIRGNPDLDDTIRRLQAFEKAGADVLFAPGLPTLDAIRQVCAAVTKPVNIMAGMPKKTFSLAELADAGVKRVSLGASLHRAALDALISAGREIQSGTFHFAERLPASAEIYRLIGR
jgi:2-methylisocitrate lyase-like PEP mutase family enzyme